ncbi:MAG: hypothetical protein RL701_106 [Pseudomonadota bacterium]
MKKQNLSVVGAAAALLVGCSSTPPVQPAVLSNTYGGSGASAGANSSATAGTTAKPNSGGAGSVSLPPPAAGVSAPYVAGSAALSGGGGAAGLAGTLAAVSGGQGGGANQAGAGLAGASGGPGTNDGPTERCTGKAGKKGNDMRTYDKEGAAYIVHFPSNLDPNEPVPLIYVAHGFTMDGASMQSITGFDAVADANKFVVVYPTGDGGATPWNVGDAACLPGGVVNAPAADSFGYLEAIKASIEVDQCIDAKKVFVTGFSMGGYFSHNVGCKIGNTFARAVGPHSGGTYPGDCPGSPVPVFIMHGDADTFIDYRACGQGARDYWLARNKCGAKFDTKMVMGGSCDWYQDCDANGQTVFCSFNGIGHAWARGATDAVWNFFKSYL